MADKYITEVGGIRRKVEGSVTSAGAGDAGKIVALDGGGKLSTTVLPSGLGVTSQSIIASEALAAGDLVNKHFVANVLNVRKADASSANAGRRADGYVKAAVSAAASATVFFEGINDAVTGLSTAGDTRLYLSTTPGGVTPTSPTTAGHFSQHVGTALSSTAYLFQPEAGVIQ